MQLDERLRAIASFVPQGTVLADIGTDHAYLPIYLLEQKKITRAIATDVADGPLLVAKSSISAAGFQDLIQTRKGDGLSPLSADEVDTITIAGMGGSTIAGIIERNMLVAQAVDRLVLQPMGESGILRRFLYQNSWFIADELLVKESGHLYQILSVKKSTGQSIIPDKLALELGPVLKEKRPEYFKEHVQNVIFKYRYICDNMAKSENAVKSKKYQTVQKFLQQLEVFWQCL